MRRTGPLPLALAASAFVLAGGWIHLQEWLDVYRNVPASAPGSAMVRIGFPLNAAVSVVLAALLIVGATVRPRAWVAAVAANVAFQIGSLAALVLSRVGSLLGWQEPVWTEAAEKTRAVEVGALVCLALVVAVGDRVSAPVGSRSRALPHLLARLPSRIARATR